MASGNTSEAPEVKEDAAYDAGYKDGWEKRTAIVEGGPTAEYMRGFEAGYPRGFEAGVSFGIGLRVYVPQQDDMARQGDNRVTLPPPGGPLV